jgi:hypothetical protein
MVRAPAEFSGFSVERYRVDFLVFLLCEAAFISSIACFRACALAVVSLSLMINTP